MKQEDMAWINSLAANDHHIMEKCVVATDGWKLGAYEHG
jgi:hypothetical protein